MSEETLLRPGALPAAGLRVAGDARDVYPLTPMQHAMLLRSRRDERSGVYLQQFVCRLNEELRVAELRAAWEALVERHPALRTSFVLDALPEPAQRVHSRIDLPWEEHDWRGMAPAAREERWREWLRADRARAFDPERAPLLRLALFRTGERRWRLLWTSHHALMDGYARRFLVREVFEHYAALVEGRAWTAPEREPFGEYAAWLRREDPAPARAFWIEALRGFAAPNELPPPAGEGQEGRGMHRFALSEELTAALEDLGGREEVTLNTVLQGAWALLLARYSGDGDVVFGANRACRRSPVAGTEAMVGLFSNTVPVRARVRGGQTVRGFLHDLRATWVAMRPHERAHLSAVQQWSEVPSGTPLFHTLFGFERETLQEGVRALSGAWARRRFQLLQWTGYPLAALAHGGRRVTFQVVHDRARVPDTAIRRLEAHLTAILRAFAADPGRRLDTIDLLSPAERHRVVDEWNPRRSYDSARTLHDWFAARAARTPGSIALTFEDASLTYAELDARSNRIARALRRRGVGPESRVGICLDRGLDLVATILGVLKAGGAYVPIDPAYPADRIAYTLGDSGARVLVTTSDLVARIPEHGAQILAIDTDAAAIEAESSEAMESGAGPENAAYVIYTSGSTGRPKGVVVEHRQVARLMTATEEWYGFGQDDVWTLFHSASFDFSVWEIWGALLYGGRLVVVPYLVSRSPDQFRGLLAREGVTVLNQTPSAFRALIRADEEAHARGDADDLKLRFTIFGGEALDPATLRGWMDRHGEDRPRFVNMYGITETTVHVTYRPLDASDLARGSVIGGAIQDLAVYVLDHDMRPAPIGVPGELYVGGAGLARGYLGRPSLTAQRFVPDPFAGDAGARLYRSGDRARWLESGELEYLGRLDEQVKIRGFRIELGEIESALLSHPQVREAAVLVRDDASGEKSLAAYLVPRGAAPSATALRAHLRERLPDFMVPAAFVAMDRLPLTTNGKLDRRALPEPERGGGEEIVAPRTPLEELLAGIWAEVLGVERVGAHDSFFALGGHSLLAARVASRVREALGADLPLAAFFAAPTLAELAAAVEAHGGAADDAPPVVPVARGADLPLSAAQRRLWLAERLHPGAAYNVPVLLRLAGALDADALQRALDWLAARHEALRTAFPEAGGEPLQRIHPPAPVALPVLDLAGIPGAEELARSLCEAEARRPFDLERGPVFRALLARADSGLHLLLIAVHHVAADGESMAVLARELREAYAAFARGAAPSLSPPAVHPADHAAWEAERWSGGALEPAVDWWRARLAGLHPLLLPTDRPRSGTHARGGARHRLALAPETAEGVRRLARERAATPYMVLLAAFQALLARWSGEDDVAVGTPVAVRPRAELDGAVGFFGNTLVLRADLSGDPAFAEALARVRRAALDAFERRAVPFERLAEESGPLFRVMFAFQAGAERGWALPGLDVQRLPVERGAAKFDLMLTLEEADGAIAGAWEYDDALFDRETVERMAAAFSHLLDGALAAPETPLSALPLLDDAERRRILSTLAGDDAPTPAPTAGTLHAAFAAQAARTPDALAVVCDGGSLTFAELDARANRLARALRRRGVGAESRVGLAAERSPELLVGILGILKAGGAYVPLDPAHPRDRLRAVLADAGARVLVTQSHLADRLPAPDGGIVEADGEEVAMESDAPLDDAALPGSTAYVIYTSGSTGTPKGVVVEHRSVLNLLEALRTGVYAGRRGGEGPARVSMNGPATFDTSVKQWIQLLRGCTVCIVPERVRADAPALAGWLAEHAVEVFDCTPAQLRLMLDGGFLDEGMAAPADVLVAGEAVDAATWARLAALPHRRFHNLYGPTECTVDASLCAVDESPAAPSIGRAVAGARLYVLDARGEPVPVGVAGELYVGGAGVSRGYLGRPGMTAEKFVPDPFSTSVGARMYRTGDRARWRADGRLDFLGRADHQVKVRGHRVELGEIEAALLAHPAVAQAAAAVREEGGEARLVAYVAPAPGVDALIPAELRAWMAERLPAYLLPQSFVLLDRLPLSAHGKVDRRALPAPTEADAAQGDGAAPRTPVEEVVAAVWADVLGLERVGAHDDFFALGGHSLLAARAVGRLRAALGAEFPLAALFEAPTPAAFAARVEAARADGAAPPLPPIARIADDVHPPLSSAQRRLWFLQRMEPVGAAYNVPYAFRLRGPLDAAALRGALDVLAARHEPLRTRLVEVGGEPAQVVDPAGPVAFSPHDLRHLPVGEREIEIGRLLRAEAARPFALEAEAPFRAVLIAIADDENVLAMVFHHAAMDAWSAGVLFREMESIYAARVRGEAPALAPLPLRYADFAAWQRAWTEGDAAREPLRWWRERLGDAPALLELPTDRPRPAEPGSRGGRHAFVLDEDATRGLRALARRSGSTLFMTLLAGFQALLARYAGTDDVAVGTPADGRSRPELEGLVGFFVNTLVVRTDLSGDPTAGALVERVRRGVLEAHARQDLPFERVVDELRPARTLRHTPLFQVMFAFQQGDDAPRLPGLDVEPIPLAPDEVKFDLALTFRERGGRLSGTLAYRAELWDRATVRRMARHLSALLAAMAADPERRISALEPMSARERRLLVGRLGRSARTEVPTRTLHGWFAAQAARTPDSVAVTFEDASLTYAELDARSNRIARILRRRGVGPESRVGICLDRGLDLVAAILGVLKAGGAYVPIDPAYPADRIAYTLGDSGARVLVTTSDLAVRLPAHTAEVLCVDTDAGAIEAESSEPMESGAGPENAAYVIYTSGSTGRPKGVVVEHRQVARLMTETEAWYGFGPDDVWTLFHSASFDFSVWEIWGALLYGGRVVVVPYLVSRSPDRFRDLLAREKVTVLNQTPSAFRALIRADEEAHARGDADDLSLRFAIFGGEALDPATLRGWMERYGEDRPRFVNMYGITETTVHVTYRPLGAGDLGRGSVIGRAIPDLSLYVLDEAIRPCPIGVPGELYVGGAGLARGYLGRPGLTAQRFVPDPFGAEPGARLYRSGDRARWLGTGELEYLGRLDEQVKIRGFRIELGEIESALLSHPQVREAAVLVRDDASGEKSLAAYLVPRGDAPTAAALRAHLRDRLPEFMVPAAFVAMDRLPLTTNGKLDRRALPAPEAARAETEDGAAPRTPAQERLAALWAEVLGRDRVGVDESFFDLGGHSLLAVRLIARIERETGRRLPLQDLFRGATVARMAELLESNAAQPRRSPLVVLRDADGPPVFFVHAADGHVLSYARLAARCGGARAIHALEAPWLEGGPLPASVEEMAEAYVAALRATRPRGPYALAGWSFGGVVAWEMARVLHAAGERVDRLALIDVTRRVRDPGAEDEAGFWAGALRNLLDGELPDGFSHAAFARMPADERLAYVHARAIRAGALPAEFDAERLAAILRARRAHLEALRRYRPGEYAGSAAFFDATDHPCAAAARGSGRRIRWKALCRGGTIAHRLRGNHFTLLREPHVAALAQCLDAYLADGDDG